MEKPPELEISPEMRVRDCVTLDELYYVLRDIGEIEGSRGHVYTGEQIVHIIQEAASAREGGLESEVQKQIDRLPRTYGIRKKVRDLLATVPIQDVYSRAS